MTKEQRAAILYLAKEYKFTQVSNARVLEFIKRANEILEDGRLGTKFAEKKESRKKEKYICSCSYGYLRRHGCRCGAENHKVDTSYPIGRMIDGRWDDGGL